MLVCMLESVNMSSTDRKHCLQVTVASHISKHTVDMTVQLGQPVDTKILKLQLLGAHTGTCIVSQGLVWYCTASTSLASINLKQKKLVSLIFIHVTSWYVFLVNLYTAFKSDHDITKGILQWQPCSGPQINSNAIVLRPSIEDNHLNQYSSKDTTLITHLRIYQTRGLRKEIKLVNRNSKLLLNRLTGESWSTHPRGTYHLSTVCY